MLVPTSGRGLGWPEELGRGYFVKPTVFGNVSNNMTIAREEIFGPVGRDPPTPGSVALARVLGMRVPLARRRRDSSRSCG
jgi:hypothetical protein